MIKIDLITGILGSGKTTFIRKYARYLLSKGMRIAILENDFGAVNVDMMMLQDLSSENCQLAMIVVGGDPDCHKRRFKTQLINLGMQSYDRIIMEPSGIFDMDEFFDTLYESPVDKWFEVGSIITVIDSEMSDTLTEEYEYLLASEASCCGKLVLSKLCGNDNADKAERAVEHINRALMGIQCSRRFTKSDIIAKDWRSLTDADFEALMNVGYRTSSYVKQYTTESIDSSVHYFMHVRLSENIISKVIDEIFNDTECGDISRIKGALPVGEKWLAVNITKTESKISEVGEGQAVLIVIGQNISREKIDAHLKKYNSDPEYISI